MAVQTSPTFSAGAGAALFSARGYSTNTNRRQYDVAPGDKRFIFVRPVGGAAATNIVFVENWFAEMKAK